MDLLLSLPLPQDIIYKILSYGYCHPSLNNLPTNNLLYIHRKNKVIEQFTILINCIIYDNINEILYYNKKKQKLLPKKQKQNKITT